jgi:hypothetical protein
VLKHLLGDLAHVCRHSVLVENTSGCRSTVAPQRPVDRADTHTRFPDIQAGLPEQIRVRLDG